LLAPRVLGADGTPEDAVRANLTPLSLLTRHGLQKRKALQPSEPACRGRRFYWLAGMFMLLRSTAYRAVGGFDERFFLYCEDYDLCARLYLAGNAIMLVEQASVIHEAQRDSRRSSKHLRWHLQSLGRVWRSRAFWRVLSSNLVQRSNIPNC
jgi:GT2 family glycosyltransferase